MRGVGCVVCGMVLVGLACTDPVDKAAKQRIFSPEDPPQVVASAAEKLPPGQIADDPRIARRILDMGAAEVTERLGPHQFNAQLTYDWGAQNGASNKMTEKRALVAGPGGVAGDFDAKLTNSRSQGFEILRVGGKVYQSDTYRKLRLRSRDRGMAERTRQDVFGALQEVDTIFGGRLKLQPQGTVSYEGRTAARFEVVLGASGAADASALKLPAPAFARAGGMDEPTKRRQLFFAKRQPQSLSGEVLVDATAFVVLKAHVEGRLEVRPEGNTPGAALHLTLDSALTQIGKDPGLKTPTDFLPDQDKPSGIADALDRFGIPRGGKADAGTATEEEP